MDKNQANFDIFGVAYALKIIYNLHFKFVFINVLLQQKIKFFTPYHKITLMHNNQVIIWNLQFHPCLPAPI